MAQIKKICIICGKEFIAKSKKAKYCSYECKYENYKLNHPKKVFKKICPTCNKEFIANFHAQKYCCKKCQDIIENEKARNLHILQRNSLFNENSIEGYDYITCPICKQKFKQITLTHFKIHNINTFEELNNLYPNLQLTCNKLIEKHLKGSNNPMSKENTSEQKRKESSPYSLEYYKKHGAKTEDEAKEQRQKFLDKIKPLRKNWIQASQLEYYLNKGFNIEEAIRLRREKYKSNGLDWYIEKFGEIEGKEKYEKRIQYWVKQLHNGSQHSKISDNFFDTLIKNINEEHLNNIFYGDNEFIITDENRSYKPDFINIKTNKIIEFYGDYWHSNPVKYDKNYYNKTLHLYTYEIWDKDKKRITQLEKLGYKILIIWEYEYKKNPEYFINKCIQFLNETNETNETTNNTIL